MRISTPGHGVPCVPQRIACCGMNVSIVCVSESPYAASKILHPPVNFVHCSASGCVSTMPKLVAGFTFSDERSNFAASGCCITATFIGAMLYHQLTS